MKWAVIFLFTSCAHGEELGVAALDGLIGGAAYAAAELAIEHLSSSPARVHHAKPDAGSVQESAGKDADAGE